MATLAIGPVRVSNCLIAPTRMRRLQSPSLRRASDCAGERHAGDGRDVERHQTADLA